MYYNAQTGEEVPTTAPAPYVAHGWVLAMRRSGEALYWFNTQTSASVFRTGAHLEHPPGSAPSTTPNVGSVTPRHGAPQTPKPGSLSVADLHSHSTCSDLSLIHI